MVSRSKSVVSALKTLRVFPWWEVPATLLEQLAAQSAITRINNLLKWLSEDRPDLFEAFSDSVLRHKVASFLEAPDLPQAPKSSLGGLPDGGAELMDQIVRIEQELDGFPRHPFPLPRTIEALVQSDGGQGQSRGMDLPSLMGMERIIRFGNTSTVGEQWRRRFFLLRGAVPEGWNAGDREQV